MTIDYDNLISQVMERFPIVHGKLKEEEDREAMENSAFKEGYKAYSQDDIIKNPYDESDYRFVEWNNGFACANEDLLRDYILMDFDDPNFDSHLEQN